MSLQSLKDDLDGCTILLTDLIVNQYLMVVLAFYGNKLLRATYVGISLLASINWALVNFSKRDLHLAPSVFVFVCAVVLNLFIYSNLLFFVVAACHFDCFDDSINKLFMLLADHRYI